MTLDEAYQQYAATKSTPDLLATIAAAKHTTDNAIKTNAGMRSPRVDAAAKLLVANAIKKYNPAAGTKLSTYIMYQMQPLKRIAAKQRYILSTPEAVRQEQQRAAAAATALQEKLGRDPTDVELADETGIAVRRLGKLRTDYYRSVPESMRVSPEGDPVQDAVDYNPREKEWLDYVYHDLDNTNRQILEHRIGYNGKPTLGTGDIAKKLGISASAVSQRIKSISDLLDSGSSYYGDK